MINDCFIYLFLAIVSVILLIYYYYYWTRNHDYWSKQGLQGPRPVPVLGTLVYELLYNKSTVEVNWMKTFGKIYGIFDGNKPILRVAEPELIKQIIVKDFHIFTDKVLNPNKHPIFDKILVTLKGDDWKRVRSIVSPTFTSGKMKKMYPLIRECLKDCMSALEVLSNDGMDVNMKTLYGQYASDMIATCAFATKIDLYNNPNHPFITNAMQLFTNASNIVYVIYNLTLPTFALNYLQTQFRSNTAEEYFFDIIRGIMKERKTSNKSYNDYIELMMNLEKSEDTVRDDNDINESHHVNEGEEELEIENKSLSGVERYITENEMIANAFGFLLAGYETTATTLSHCTQELALNPEVQEKLYSETMSSVDSNGEIDYDLLTKLPYLDAVISETLRLHSPVLRLFRIASEDYKLGDTGITIFKGQEVQIPIYAIHRCEEYYPNADHFIPERFLPENKSKIIPYTYLPFGGGPRKCVGMRFALLETKLALAHVVRKFKILRSSNTDIPVLLSKSTLLHTPQRIIVKIFKRI